MIKEKDLEYIHQKLNSSEKDKLHEATILITGCAGFIGYYLLHYLAGYGHKLGIRKIIGLDNFLLGKPDWIEHLEKNKLVETHKFDIIYDDPANIAETQKTDFVLHMASIASPVFYRRYPIETLDANVWGLRKLLDFYTHKSLRGFLFFSSSELYGNPDGDNIPTTEDYNGNVSATGPRACYDEAKRFGETMCMLFAQKYKMPIGVVRPFNNYGPGMKITDQRAPADFAQAIYQGKDITILSDGAPTRTFCYIADAVVGYLKVLLYGKYDYFNIGMDRPEISIRQMAELYVEEGRKIFDYQGKAVFGESGDVNYLSHNPQRRCPNIDKARKLLGYSPEIEIQEGVGRFLSFLQQNEKSEFIW